MMEELGGARRQGATDHGSSQRMHEILLARISRCGFSHRHGSADDFRLSITSNSSRSDIVHRAQYSQFFREMDRNDGSATGRD